MATYLHYQIWVQKLNYPVVPLFIEWDGREKLLASGTFAVSVSMSAPVAIPDLVNQPSDAERRLLGLFKVVGTERVFVDARPFGIPVSTSAPAAVDAVPRHLFSSADGYVGVALPSGGQFGAVQAAALA